MAVARSASAVRSFYAETRADEQSRGPRQQVAVAGKEKATLVRTFAVSGRESAEEAIYYVASTFVRHE